MRHCMCSHRGHHVLTIVRMPTAIAHSSPHHQCINTNGPHGLQRPTSAKAAAPPLAPPANSPQSQFLKDVGRMPEHERQALAKRWGYRQVGKELPEGVKLTDIVKTLPKEVFKINNARSWLTCITSLIAFPASLALIAVSPWWLLPVAWAVSGTAFTGWFVIGHDCGHRSFHTNKLVEDIVGNFFFAPLLYPFEPWRIKHNQHHTYTNKLEDDTAWHPVMKNEVDDMNKSGPAGVHPPSLRPQRCAQRCTLWLSAAALDAHIVQRLQVSLRSASLRQGAAMRMTPAIARLCRLRISCAIELS